MIDDQPVSDRQGFVVGISPVKELWDSTLQNVAIGVFPHGWTYHRTTPHPLTGLKPAEVAYHGQRGIAITSIYPTFDSLVPEHTHISNIHNPLGAIKRVLEIQ